MVRLQNVIIISLLILLGTNVVKSEGECNPLVKENCLLPFPNFYLKRDPTTLTGFRMNLSSESFPKDINGVPFNPGDWNKLDGFGTFMSFNTYFPDVYIDDPSIPRWWNIEKSILPTSPILLLDTVTSKYVPVWAELDASSNTTDLRTLMIWPASKLEYNRRYIVIIRNLRNTKGQLIQPTQEFLQLRNNTPSTNPDVEKLRVTYKDIFSILSNVGININELQITWDFTTMSRANASDILVYMRDDATRRLPPGGPTYTISSVEDNYSDKIYRRVEGEYDVPLYLDSDMPGARLVYDESGKPAFQRWAKAKFVVIIPRKAFAPNAEPLPLLQYGHGLFGRYTESQNSVNQNNAENFGWITYGTDLWGLSALDVPSVVYMVLTNVSNFGIVPDRNAQGIINSLVLTKLLSQSLVNDPNFIHNGRRLIDPSRRWYNGNSQGGISGTMVMALSQDLQRGCLGVPGAPYNLLLPRSVDFDELFFILKLRYPNPIDRINWMNIFGLIWEKSEPTGYLDAVIKNPLKNTPRKEVIIQYSLGDAQVSWLGSLAMGRSMGVSIFENHVTENNDSLFGLPVVRESNTTGGALIGFKYENVPPSPIENIPPLKATDTHQLPRRDPRGLEQVDIFFKTGRIYNTCGRKGCVP